MADPVRLYSPNPDAPSVWGAPPTPRNRLAEVMAAVPSPFEVLSPPAAARQSYGSLARTMVDMTSPAAVRDTVDASGQTMDAARQGDVWGALGGTASMLAAGVGAIPGGRLITKGAKELAQPIRAWHSSPHDFDKFDFSKIGTGEGNQSYGHGGYFAENPAVSGPGGTYYKQFERRLEAQGGTDLNTRFNSIKVGGEPLMGRYPIDRMDEAVTLAKSGNAADFQKWAEKRLSSWQAQASDPIYQFRDYAVEKVDAYKRLVADLNAGAPVSYPRPHSYEVNIHADPNMLADWDKPLIQQSAPVRSAMEGLGFRQGSTPDGPTNLGADLKRAYTNPLYLNDAAKIPADVSAALREAGIPGIKYLDGGSRAAGDGSRNYVTFSDKIVEILRKYGMLPVAAGGAAVAATQPDERAF